VAATATTAPSAGQAGSGTCSTRGVTPNSEYSTARTRHTLWDRLVAPAAHRDHVPVPRSQFADGHGQPDVADLVGDLVHEASPR
jgi:hypothetical protein